MGDIAQGVDIPTTRRRQPSSRASYRARARFWDRVVTATLWALAVGVAGLLLYIILYMLLKGLSALSWSFITTATITGGADGPEVFNTFYVITLALLVCVP